MLHRIALDALEEGYAEEDFAFRANKPALTVALMDWLKAHAVAWPIIEATAPSDYFTCDDGSADKWLEDRVRRQEAAQATDPDLRSIATLLHAAGYAPEPINLSDLAAGLETYDDLFEDVPVDGGDEAEANEVEEDAIYIPPERFQVFAAGDTLRVLHGAALLPEIADQLHPVPEPLQADLRPHLLALRERLADDTPGEGLWPAADLDLFADGSVVLTPR
jgi:hypothetical protein